MFQLSYKDLRTGRYLASALRPCAAVVMLISLLLPMPTAFTAEPNGMVILHTDYGADSVYVGMLKGAIYHRFPAAKIDSYTNSIPAFDIALGAQMLVEGVHYYPKGTVFCCVVDPGVGTERRGIALETASGHFFVAPDNGLLQGVVERLGVARVHAIENRALWREGQESTTFHGRDIFGPIAASLASGTPLAEVGSPLNPEELYAIDIAVSTVSQDIIHGRVMRVDDYGNIVTNVSASQLEQLEIALGESLFVTIGKHAFSVPLVRTYGEVPPGDRLACIQSFQLVELAANMNHLADQIGAKAHMALTFRKEQDTLFDYRRSGGTLTHPERLVIHRDGDAFVARADERHDFTVDATTLEALQEAADAVDWTPAPRPKEAPVVHGADYFTIDLHYSGHNLHATSLEMPKQLEPLLARLNSLLNP